MRLALLAVVAVVGLGAGFLLRVATDDDSEPTTAVATQVVTTTVLTTTLTGTPPTPSAQPPASPTPAEVVTPTSSPTPIATPWPGIQITTVILREEEETYSIDAEYPHTGLPIDAAIQDAVEGTAADIRRLAEDQPPGTFGIPGPYILDAGIASLYVSPGVVSVRLHIYTYTGGAHGNGIIYGFNAVPSDGRELALHDALSMIDLSLAEVAEKVVEELESKLDGAFFSEGALPEPGNYQTFVVGPDQVTFVFQSYQVAPYAAGPQEVSFPRTDTSP
jgi:hypothetical protein